MKEITLLGNQNTKYEYDYNPKIYCKLKNYNILTNKGINIDNDKLINKINELNTCVLL